MKHSNLILALALSLSCVKASADDEGIKFPPIDHAATLKECGTCHLVFPPQMLPARSWDKLIGGLTNHFGENAALETVTREDILKYLSSHAADAPATMEGSKFMRGITKDVAPLRITETPYWTREHHEIRESQFKDPKVKSKANCIACHKTADKGEFREEED
jgi:hypothetical protein